MKNWYKNLESRYASFPSHIQILNMVSDLQKADHLMEHNPENATNHLYRAIILLDYIIADPKWRIRLRELLRLRETIGSLIYLSKPYCNYHQLPRVALLLDSKAYRTFYNI